MLPFTSKRRYRLAAHVNSFEKIGSQFTVKTTLKVSNSGLLAVMHKLSLFGAGFVFAMASLAISESAFAQQGDEMNMNETMTIASSNVTGVESSPINFNIPNGNVQVRLSWQPETINTDGATKFTFEFLDTKTGEHLKDVSYSVHTMLDRKSVVHGHEATVPDGFGTLEQKFSSKGALSIVIESIKVGNTPINDFAQFNLTVVPEFPTLLVIMATGLAGSLVVSRMFIFHKKTHR